MANFHPYLLLYFSHLVALAPKKRPNQNKQITILLKYYVTKSDFSVNKKFFQPVSLKRNQNQNLFQKLLK
jgi:hypothetical protein